MRINDTKEYFGKSFTAVEYVEPMDFQPTDDDPQCKKAEYQMLWRRLAELRKTNVNWAAIS